jgi:hypothetical protein
MHCRLPYRQTLSIGYVALAILLTGVSAGAQTPTPPRTLDPKPCSDPAIEARRNANPSAQGTEGRADTNENLSERLSNSNGVLCPPPEVDPSVKAPPPSVTNTPVIPPPGSPGGDPTVRPK